jgi:N-terminal domain of ribose phosphate pyrophosphokinase
VTVQALNHQHQQSSSSWSSQQRHAFAAASLLAAGGAAMLGGIGGLSSMSSSSCEAAATGVQPKTYPTPDYFDYEAGDDEDDHEETSYVTTTTAKTTGDDGKTPIAGSDESGDDDGDDDDDDDDSEESKPKDPMTIYAKMAILQEMKEQQIAVEESKLSATSPTEDRKNASLEAQKEAIEKGEFQPGMSPDELRIEEATRKAKQHSGALKLFSGNGNLALALEICRSLGINLGKATVGRFADGEANVVVHENVRGKDCYVIQPTCPPVNDNIMELLLMVSTLRRASARRITVVIPYYGYARQDRKMQVRQS